MLTNPSKAYCQVPVCHNGAIPIIAFTADLNALAHGSFPPKTALKKLVEKQLPVQLPATPEFPMAGADIG